MAGGDAVGEVRVTMRGQLSLPARARHRWDLADGGRLGWIDLGDAVLFVPGGEGAARRLALDQLRPEDWADAALGFGDPDLANQ